MLDNRCKNCFEVSAMPCRYCGYRGYHNEELETLAPGTILNGKYMIGKKLGRGGFGITYLALDVGIDTKVCIKEYYPSKISSRARGTSKIVPYTGDARVHFDKGLKRFSDEGRALKKFNSLESTVEIFEMFFENNTGYMVMEYIDGKNVSEILKSKPGGKLDYFETMDIMRPIMMTLEQVHNSGLIHRDIAPDNIMVSKDGEVRLLDFGAARYAMAGNDQKSLSVILKEGYAPIEQYSSRGKQGAWTDVYAVAATMFRILTGRAPVVVTDRQMNDNEFQSQLALLPPELRGVFAHAMALRPNDRIKTVKELRYLIQNNMPLHPPKDGGKKPIVPVGPVTTPPKKKKYEPKAPGSTLLIIMAVLLAIAVVIVGMLALGVFDDKEPETDDNNTVILENEPTEEPDRDDLRELRIEALSNAQVIASCLNAHNQLAKTDEEIEPILGKMTDSRVLLYNEQFKDISNMEEFNASCENEISDIEEEEFLLALEYLELAPSGNELTQSDTELMYKDGYDHTFRVQYDDALDAAKTIISCVNAHNALAETDSETMPILVKQKGKRVLMYNDNYGDISNEEEFNASCNFDVNGISEDEFMAALTYIEIADDERSTLLIKDDYDHTNPYAD